jgi:hypothetical protein
VKAGTETTPVATMINNVAMAVSGGIGFLIHFKTG